MTLDVGYDVVMHLEAAADSMAYAVAAYTTTDPAVQAELDAIVALIQAARALVAEAKTALDNNQQDTANAKVKQALEKLEAASKRLAALH